jgi:hypothetical protein
LYTIFEYKTRKLSGLLDGSIGIEGPFFCDGGEEITCPPPPPDCCCAEDKSIGKTLTLDATCVGGG